MRGRMGGMADKQSTWRKTVAKIFAVLALLSLVVFFQGRDNPQAPTDAAYILGALTPPAIFAGLTIFFYAKERAQRRK
jgi:hypothetical protein